MKMVVTDLFNKFIIDSYILIHAPFFSRSPLLSKCQPFWVCDGSQTDAFATNFLCLNDIAEAILPTTGNHVEIHMP